MWGSNYHILCVIMTFLITNYDNFNLNILKININ